MKLVSIITTSYTTFRKCILSSVYRHKSSENISLKALILKCQKTGKKTDKGDEVKLLLHISPSNSRSYIQEYTEVYPHYEITHYLQPGQLVKLEMNSLKGKASLSWNE